jgi:uncharacterized protein YprB with RNaseH-like and TPR domain
MTEKIGIFDIETTGLPASYSHMLAWCMLDRDTGKIASDIVTRKEARDKHDVRVTQSAIKEIEKYDRIVGYYSSRFDIPYVRSRALKHKLIFPAYRDLYHTDLYFVARSKFRLHSNRLKAICEFLSIPAKTHPFTMDLWERAGAGEAEALKTVLTHCEEDVESTNEVLTILLDHMLFSKRSI